MRPNSLRGSGLEGKSKGSAHFVVEDLGLSRLGLRNEDFIENLEDILADALELRLDLLAVVADGADVLVGALGLLLLLDRRDYAPGSTAGTHDVLVGDREEVTLVYRQLTGDLGCGLDNRRRTAHE